MGKFGKLDEIYGKVRKKSVNYRIIRKIKFQKAIEIPCVCLSRKMSNDDITRDVAICTRYLQNQDIGEGLYF